MSQQQQEQEQPCETQLLVAESCINADTTITADTANGNDDVCSCVPYPFRDTFSFELEGSFQRTLAFYSPNTDKEFCKEANKNVCE